MRRTSRVTDQRRFVQVSVDEGAANAFASVVGGANRRRDDGGGAGAGVTAVVSGVVGTGVPDGFTAGAGDVVTGTEVAGGLGGGGAGGFGAGRGGHSVTAPGGGTTTCTVDRRSSGGSRTPTITQISSAEAGAGTAQNSAAMTRPAAPAPLADIGDQPSLAIAWLNASGPTFAPPANGFCSW